MKPSELYKRTPERIDKDINRLYGCYFNHVPEIEAFDCGTWIEDGKNERVEIHYYKDYSFDVRRIWTLAAVKFDDKFVMVIQNAGREGDDYVRRFITDIDTYNDMVAYIATLIPPDENKSQGDVRGVDEDIDGLDEFYESRLDGIFRPYGYY